MSIGLCEDCNSTVGHAAYCPRWRKNAMTTPTQWDIDRAALEKRLTNAALDLLGFMAAHEATVPIQNTNPQLVVFVGEQK